MSHIARLARKFALPAVAVLGLGVSQARAAVTWDFTDITGEMDGLATALMAGIGIAITAGIVIYGIYRAWGVLSKMFSRVINK